MASAMLHERPKLDRDENKKHLKLDMVWKGLFSGLSSGNGGSNDDGTINIDGMFNMKKKNSGSI